MKEKKDSPIYYSGCHFEDYHTKSALVRKRKLGMFINHLVLHYTQKENALNYVFVTDEFLHDMNLKYLNHDTLTDIITFDLSDKSSNNIMAEIYISMDRVRENARNEKVKIGEELLRVIIHGALHICGFKDSSAEEKAEMRQLENYWLNQYLTQ